MPQWAGQKEYRRRHRQARARVAAFYGGGCYECERRLSYPGGKFFVPKNGGIDERDTWKLVPYDLVGRRILLEMKMMQIYCELDADLLWDHFSPYCRECYNEWLKEEHDVT